MNTDLYSFLIFNKIKYPVDSLEYASLHAEVKGVLAVMGLPEIDLLDMLIFDPCLTFDQHHLGGRDYYKLGCLIVYNRNVGIFIDTTRGHIWIESGADVQFANSNLSCFLLFMEIYGYSIVKNFDKQETRELLEQQYIQLKTQFEAIDSQALLGEDNLWPALLSGLKFLSELDEE